ncbi:S-layer homology domain-containing protein [Paenibacillus sp.]|uniref:S-layer homology domain-containing protein n=1 Tax=Paenibacillus sp. TaxID=58172 RepID=UPI002810B12E|nr:S-layer homology domain-containing protein [Paenibacillus sp.]
MNHKIRKPFAVLTTVALTASLLLGTGATAFAAETPATTTTAGVKLTFPDIVPTHWAKSHVAKLASAGIVKGYTDGGFRPSQDVTQQEAIVMVIRMVGLEEEALAGSGDIVTGFQEDAFFTKYVVKALEERIIDMSEETAAAASGTTPWGKRPATREWVSKLIVRALGEQPASGALGFADASDVSAGAAGYVAKSQELELVTGFTDNTFKPKDAVTRAQIATILSRADKYIPDDESKYTSGLVTSLSGSSLVLQPAGGGAARTFGLNAETLVFDAEGGSLDRSALTSLTPVRVIHQGGQAYYIEVTGGAVELESIDGELEALDIASSSLVLRRSNGTLEQYDLTSTVTVTNAGGTGLSLSQLNKGSEIRLQRMAGTAEVSAIVLIEEAFNAKGTGIVQTVNAAARTVTFTDDKGSIVTYPLVDGATLTVKGQPLSDLSGIQSGDTIAYEIEDSEIVSIDITVQKYVMKTGDFQVIAGDTITIKVNSTTPEAFIMRPNAAVSIEGLTNPTISDLQVGDVVQLRLSGATNQVDQITVTNRNVTKLQNVTIDTLQAEYMIVRDAKNAVHFYKITDRSLFVLDGTAMTEQMFKTYVAAGRKVDLSVTSDQLVRLDVVTKVSGTVSAVNTTARTITVTTADNGSTTLPFAQYAVVEVPQQSSAGFADVTVGAKVHMSMGYNTNEVQMIQVEKSFVYTLNSVTAATRTVSAKDAKGSSVSLALDSEAKVLGRDGQAIALASLTVGQPIVVNYAGRRVVSVQEPAAVVGKVSTLDTTAGKLSVTDYNGNVKNYSLTGGISIQKGTTVSTSASSLQLNDRVSLIVDAQGKPYVYVAQAETRKFSGYDAAKNEVSFKIARVGDQSKYTVEPNVKVTTAAGASMTMNQLKENDTVVVYLMNGKIVELVKQ